MRNKLISFCLIAWLVAVLPLTVMAQPLDHSQKGSISVTMVSSGTEQPMAGAELSVYYVATVAVDTAGNLNYICDEVFLDGGISLEDKELISQLDAFVSEYDVYSQKMITDSQGKATCRELPLGLYFVKQTGQVEGFAPCAPFLVTVPMETESGYQYHVDASPKTDVVKWIDLTIKKVWNTDRSTKIPGSVTVQLLCDNTVVKTATLSEENQWQITFADLPESDAYSVKEVNVPKGFTATYAQTGYEFTVTNTATLAKTGQIIWPIPVFAFVGVVLLMIGFVLLRKPGKQNG